MHKFFKFIVSIKPILIILTEDGEIVKLMAEEEATDAETVVAADVGKLNWNNSGQKAAEILLAAF
ncbi:MAG: hypothetical protein U9N85_10275 [Bacteroidota bacterium]|nr:hypothetical protein [Bacteroidota bacterium]